MVRVGKRAIFTITKSCKLTRVPIKPIAKKEIAHGSLRNLGFNKLLRHPHTRHGKTKDSSPSDV